MATLMEVLQVECIVPNLIKVRPEKLGFADLKFDHKDNRAGNHECIDAPTHAGNVEFEEKLTLQIN